MKLSNLKGLRRQRIDPWSSRDELILEHDRRFWDGPRLEITTWDDWPMSERLPGFRIAKIHEGEGRWAYASIGAWRATSDDDHGLEFVLAWPEEDPRALWQLGTTAYYHAGPPTHRLGHGHTVPTGQPWIDGSTIDHTLISTPYPWDPDLEHCQLPERHIQVLWLMPITESERDFKRTVGLDALEQRFEEAGIDHLDLYRTSVA